MRTVIRLLFIMIVCSLGFLPAHAAKPNERDCRAIEVVIQGSKSYRIIGPNKWEVEFSNVTIKCVHKDGTPQPLRYSSCVVTPINAPSWEKAHETAISDLLQMGYDTLKLDYCPDHGCDKK